MSKGTNRGGKYKRAHKEALYDSQGGVCPLCGHSMPFEMVGPKEGADAIRLFLHLTTFNGDGRAANIAGQTSSLFIINATKSGHE